MCKTSLVRLRALLNITADKLDEKEDDEFISFHLRFLLTNFLAENASFEVLEVCLKCLTNLCSSTHRNQLLFSAFQSDRDRIRFVSQLKNSLSSGYRQLTIGLLCNLTRTEVWLNHFVESDYSELLTALFPSDKPLAGTVALILNLTTDVRIRRVVCSNGPWMKRLIAEINNQSDPEKSILFAGVIKNCCFEDDYHMPFLEDSYGLLEALLLPLCGPEDQVDSEDRQLLPKRVGSVIGTAGAVRSKSFKLKSTICQALLQLCATSNGRNELRSRGVYFVLRELHKYEESEWNDSADLSLRTMYNELIYYLEQVVDQLICGELERDKAAVETSLRNIPVDERISEKLDRIKLDYIGSLD